MNRHCIDDIDITIHYNIDDNTLEVSGMDESATYDNVDTYDCMLECITDFVEEYASGI